MFTKNKDWVDNGTYFAAPFKKLCKSEGIQFYSTMSDTKTALAESAIRFLKKLLYRCMDNYG